jgi:hypothetical protein
MPIAERQSRKAVEHTAFSLSPAVSPSGQYYYIARIENSGIGEITTAKNRFLTTLDFSR